MFLLCSSVVKMGLISVSGMVAVGFLLGFLVMGHKEVTATEHKGHFFLTPPSIKLATILFKKKKYWGFKRIDAFELWCWRRL